MLGLATGSGWQRLLSSMRVSSLQMQVSTDSLRFAPFARSAQLHLSRRRVRSGLPSQSRSVRCACLLCDDSERYHLTNSCAECKLCLSELVCLQFWPIECSRFLQIACAPIASVLIRWSRRTSRRKKCAFSPIASSTSYLVCSDQVSAAHDSRSQQGLLRFLNDHFISRYDCAS